ncbi:hypothetical protein GUITHDRAFT_138567 [Guillardia theta CCMP2712]|uniref:Uncharacterized protein n=1 Tax=Guillardia theta (strain CCMP2712) TaxID=905079 RepID=L1JD98_GUITC|nr:hypothetical protein GUITHDRAFT_138567 [Guillardia theta CCMP2712]EKX46094.1 hypothetical protein GUITHDRAFT_138567 [Guillardia theta CCMP2712]|eukprot:XP_005833074.1 hypothetical protein GUITHDRAFT_138567 [Guillardia theta CCMP2712]
MQVIIVNNAQRLANSSTASATSTNTNIRKKALTPALAADIFSQRSLKPGYATVESSFVARMYGVSSKTEEIESAGIGPASKQGRELERLLFSEGLQGRGSEDGSKQATGSRSSATSARGSSKGFVETSSGTFSCTRRLEAGDSPPEGSSSPGSGLEPQSSRSSCSSSAGCRERSHRCTAKRNKTVTYPWSDSESSNGCPSTSSEGGKRRGSRRDADQKKEAQGESRKRLRKACTREGQKSLVNMLLSQRRTGRPEAEILGLLRRLTNYQDEILEQQQLMLDNLDRILRALA